MRDESTTDTGETARRWHRKRSGCGMPRGTFQTIGDETSDRHRTRDHIDLGTIESWFEGQQLWRCKGANTACGAGAA